MEAGASDWLATAIALASSALFGIVVHFHRRGLDTTDGATGTLVNALALAGMFWLSSPLWIDMSWWRQPGTLVFALLGLFFPIGSLRLQMLSVPHMGAVMTGALGAATPFFAVIPALFLFDERVGLQGWAGLVVMTAAIAFAALNGRGLKRDWPLWALLLPLGAAAIRGGMQPGLKYGMETVPSSAFGVMVMATVSTVLMLAMRLVSGVPVGRPTRGWFWFALAGIAQGSALFLLSTGLRLGDMVIVVSLAATSPLWAVFYGAVIFRHERLGLRHLLVAALVVIGGGLLVTR